MEKVHNEKSSNHNHMGYVNIYQPGTAGLSIRKAFKEMAELIWADRALKYL